MIERTIEFSIRHRTWVIVAGCVLAIAGAYAAAHSPMDAVPDLSENQVLVFTEWPGHSPREIDDQISYPLSLHLQGVAGTRVVRASSDVGFSLIHLIFDDHVPFATARRRVEERLALAGMALPTGVTPRLGPDGVPTGQIFWYTVEGPGYDLARLRAVQDWYVAGQLRAVPGVAEVASVGGHVSEYHIDLDPERLLASEVSLAEVLDEVSQANVAVGGRVLHKAGAEYVARGVGWLGSAAAGDSVAPDPQRVLRDLEQVVIPTADGGKLRLSELARITWGAQPRRGVFEKDGNEVAGGVVVMRYGENPLEVTRRLKDKIQELQVGLPPDVRIIPCYDRTPLIEGAVHTVTGTLLEAMLTATICVFVVLLHLRTSAIITVTLPLSALSAFAIMSLLRWLGWVDIQTNIMSLAGIAISIGVLVDSSIVMAENVMFELHRHFGDAPVQGDIRPLVLRACRTVGRPIFFSVLIMLVSFLPVFALGGIDGRMFRPLAFTKTFALVSVAILSITLVPALCTVLIRGKLRPETDSWLVRSVMDVYRPVLSYLLDRPAALIWILCATLVLGAAPLGVRPVFLVTVLLALVLTGWTQRSTAARIAGMGSLLIVALVIDQRVQPLGIETRLPLDEGMVMDMPITVPRASVTQTGDDLKARDMQLCRFPEVQMVVGKGGRAESAFDPAPLDMIETMVEFRPREWWPRRKLARSDALQQTEAVLDGLVDAKVLEAPTDRIARRAQCAAAVDAALLRFDRSLREFAWQRNDEFLRRLGRELTNHVVQELSRLLAQQGKLAAPLVPAETAVVAERAPAGTATQLSMGPTLDEVTRLCVAAARHLQETERLPSGTDVLQYEPPLRVRAATALQTSLLGAKPPTLFTRIHRAALARYRREWAKQVRTLNRELLTRAPGTFTRLVSEELRRGGKVVDARAIEVQAQIEEARLPRPVKKRATTGGAHHAGEHGPLPIIDPHPALDKLHADLTRRFGRRLLLWPCSADELTQYGGEMDAAVQMPGWTNVWTRPIQNRVDMLATGVNTEIGVRVLGRDLNEVVDASEAIAAVLREIPGAADVIADPIRGKGYVEIHPDRARAAARGVSLRDLNDAISTALGGEVVTTTIEGRERHAVRVRFDSRWSTDEQALAGLPIPIRRASQPDGIAMPASPATIRLSEVADVRVVDGPATIKSENGLLRNYVRLNVRDRNALEFVAAARRIVAERVALPEGVFVEWTGQFEHAARTARTLVFLMPVVLGSILLILYLTYRDWRDACLMLLAVPGALAGGVIFQWLFGYKFSVPVAVGYIACFGMATATGIIMLVYLREAVEKAGGIQRLSPAGLRQAVLDGAVHRLRPKLLTEGTTILGLAPMLWASGAGADVIRPMAAPVLGGILVADEVIDLLLPVLFYWVRRRQLADVSLDAPEADRAEKASWQPEVATGEAIPITHP